MAEAAEILREEHEVVKHLLRVLTGIAASVQSGGAVPKADPEKVFDIVVNFADKCHHAKEEKALFPVLVKASPEEGGVLVHRLEGDHTAVRKLVADMRALVAAVVAGEAEARSRFAKSARAYVTILEEHIFQENTKLLPLVGSTLSAEERSALAAEFDRIEREEMDLGVHERYEHVIHDLAAKYVHA